ncbi:ABC-2 type transport system ATP-binding protein [Mucilaginibacter frigoritolerans]|jgi:ABC-2 type transport system ATP-binding protein|uniref:ABC-2 type transport system ATP-binding protein n=1 Tax=Mucilaginibacter frigoritolerans TaxID=652788 RepID=A0A562TYL1_9SPHI|nr:ABC transporter ATP-binding protein [Mucilaginibacter frigoritolerans]TWI98637.1 ABC-2 type transport system ATP-binding protein [Mucilaginibacter frigoritolerans]
MIQIKDLDFAYKKGKPIFDKLNLSLNPGHIYGLLGKNGSGKSTLLKSIAGLVFPLSGKCLINGIDVAKRTVATLEDLFFIAEDIYVPTLTSGQFLKSTAGFYPKFSITDFYAYLKTLDVDPEQQMSSMSYGQQKKAMIAFGLATNASVLIMDEPTNGLDIPSKVQFRKLIASVLNEERYIIISTHQVRDLESLIDTILILDDHKIAVENTVDELMEKLLFGLFEDTRGMKVLYEEETMRGKHAILQNTTGKYSKMDLELLFNAVTTGSNLLTEMLEKGGNRE